jgi:hypothetical protein
MIQIISQQLFTMLQFEVSNEVESTLFLGLLGKIFLGTTTNIQKYCPQTSSRNILGGGGGGSGL